MRLRDPDEGDYRVTEGDPAEAYGCQTFLPRIETRGRDSLEAEPTGGVILAGSRFDVGGLIDQDTTWDADLITVTESVEVAENATLTVSAGTRVEFAGFHRLLVRGRLWAVGRADSRIHFTAAVAQQETGWDGIEFLNVPAANDSSRLEHCIVSYAVARPADDDAGQRIIGGTHRPETGGALSVVNTSKLAVASCEFARNRAPFGAAIYCGYGSAPVLAGNLIHRNSAQWNGSALYNVYAYPKLVNNTIVDNECLAENNFYHCGAVENFNGKIVLQNNIIRDNRSNHYSGDQLVSAKDYYTHNNNILGFVGNGSNLDEDPNFLDQGNHPYQLLTGSGCIDGALAHDFTLPLANRDPAGNPRLCGDSLDIGAYEFCGMQSGMDLVPEVSEAGRLTCHPNPFNPGTALDFMLPAGGPCSLDIVDTRGRRVRQLFDGHLNSGRQTLIWDGRTDSGKALPSGVYFAVLKTSEFFSRTRMTLLK